MSKAIISAIKPIKTSLVQGQEYCFCTCGRSMKQPFCDGSHKGTGLKSQRFTAQQSGDVYLCQCKQTANAPYCDGSHKKLSIAQIGKTCG